MISIITHRFDSYLFFPLNAIELMIPYRYYDA